MYCKNCGKEIDDNAVICPHCGVQQKVFTVEIQKPQSNRCGVAGFVLSIISIWLGIFIIPEMIGFILSCVGMKLRKERGNKGVTVAGLIINIIVLLFYVFLFVLMFTLSSESA